MKNLKTEKTKELEEANCRKQKIQTDLGSTTEISDQLLAISCSILTDYKDFEFTSENQIVASNFPELLSITLREAERIWCLGSYERGVEQSVISRLCLKI